jgi:two-component system phosphate regulon response regulator PhoB
MIAGGPDKPVVLIIEDDPGYAELIERHLSHEGYETIVQDNGKKGLEIVRCRRPPPDLVVTDHFLPGLTGREVCAAIRQDERTASLPVILVTSAGEILDKVAGLRMGADDYLTKPFAPEELLARVAALLRRSRRFEAQGERLSVKDVVVDLDRRDVTVAGQPVSLRPMEYELLVLLLRAQGKVVTHDRLRSALWSADAMATSNMLQAQVKNLRDKLGASRTLIKTIVGVGYRFE